MSTHNLMGAVRAGEFEKEFKKCNNSDDKINLFRKYGVSISKEQYENIENTVAAIKRGESSAYNVFEEKNYSKGKVALINDSNLAKVSAGAGAVYDTLMSLSGVIKEEDVKRSDHDIKIWKDKGFLTGDGLF